MTRQRQPQPQPTYSVKDILVIGQMLRDKDREISELRKQLAELSDDARECYCPHCNSMWRDHTCP